MNQEGRKEWLENIKEGDEVCYHVRGTGYVLDKVVRITPSRQIKTASGKTFRDGYCKYNKWEGYFLQPPTDEVKIENLCRRLIVKISNVDFRNVPLKKLEQIAQILDGSDEK